jgi:hypothetical protein
MQERHDVQFGGVPLLDLVEAARRPGRCRSARELSEFGYRETIGVPFVVAHETKHRLYDA